MSGYGAFSLNCLHPHRKTRLTRPTGRPLLTDSGAGTGYGYRGLATRSFLSSRNSKPTGRHGFHRNNKRCR